MYFIYYFGIIIFLYRHRSIFQFYQFYQFIIEKFVTFFSHRKTGLGQDFLVATATVSATLTSHL